MSQCGEVFGGFFMGLTGWDFDYTSRFGSALNGLFRWCIVAVVLILVPVVLQKPLCLLHNHRIAAQFVSMCELWFGKFKHLQKGFKTHCY